MHESSSMGAQLRHAWGSPRINALISNDMEGGGTEGQYRRCFRPWMNLDKIYQTTIGDLGQAKY